MFEGQFIDQVLEIKKTVKKLLVERPSLRDNDQRLIISVWEQQQPKVKNLTFYSLLYALDKKYLAKPESIRRSRQKLQEVHPELRGEFYGERHKAGKFTRENAEQLGLFDMEKLKKK